MCIYIQKYQIDRKEYQMYNIFPIQYMNQHNSDELNNEERKVVRSCKESIGEDPIKEDSSQFQHIAPPRSVKNSTDKTQWEVITQEEKKKMNQALMKYHPGTHPKIKKQKKGKNQQKMQQKKDNKGGYIQKVDEDQIPSYKNPRNDRKFTQNLDQSEQISIEQSSYQEKTHQNGRNHRAQQDRSPGPSGKNHKVYFNLMLLGGASTGKTTYIQSSLRHYKQQNWSQIIKQPTTQLTQYNSGPIPTNLSLQYHIIDTPGYTHSTAHSYCEMIKTQIGRRIEVTKMNRKKAMTMSSIYEKEEREVKDERIHCCLLFFRGVRLHKDDVYILEQLHDKCIIVPVIAKGDCYTIAQIHELKTNILQTSSQLNIQYFNIEQYIRQKHPAQLPNIISGPYGKSPPFMLVSSTNKLIQKNNQIRIGRQYKWGTCYIEDEQHTEFTVLNRMLTKYLYIGFINMTNIMEDKGEERVGIRMGGVGSKIGRFLGFVAGIGIVVVLAKKLGHHEAIKG